MTKKEFIEVLDKYTELRNSHTLDRDLAGEKFADVANELEKLGLFDVSESIEGYIAVTELDGYESDSKIFLKEWNARKAAKNMGRRLVRIKKVYSR